MELTSEGLEETVFRETFKWASGKTASDRLRRPLTKEEQAYYESWTDTALAIKRLMERVLKV